MGRQTTENYAVLSASPRVIPGLNHGRVTELQKEWGEVLPQPYEQACISLDLTDLEIARALFVAVEHDTALSIEETRALNNVINQRRRVAVICALQESGIEDLWV